MTYAILDGMTTIVSIDGAGRIVLPKPIREQLGLRPASQLEISERSGYLELRPLEPAPCLVNEDGILVHQGLAAGPMADAVKQVREERIGRVSRGLRPG